LKRLATKREAAEQNQLLRRTSVAGRSQGGHDSLSITIEAAGAAASDDVVFADAGDMVLGRFRSS
jgi:hypothetical protein